MITCRARARPRLEARHSCPTVSARVPSTARRASRAVSSRARPNASICCSPPESEPAATARRLPRIGEALQHLLDRGAPLAARTHGGSHLEVFEDAHRRQHAPPLRHEDEPAARGVVRAPAACVVAVECDAPRADSGGPRVRARGAASSSPRRSRRRPHTARLCAAAATPRAAPRCGRSRRAGARPRAARCRSRARAPEVRFHDGRVWRATTWRVPSAITSPKFKTVTRSHTAATSAMSCSTSSTAVPPSATARMRRPRSARLAWVHPWPRARQAAAPCGFGRKRAPDSFVDGAAHRTAARLPARRARRRRCRRARAARAARRCAARARGAARPPCRSVCHRKRCEQADALHVWATPARATRCGAKPSGAPPNRRATPSPPSRAPRR